MRGFLRWICPWRLIVSHHQNANGYLAIEPTVNPKVVNWIRSFPEKQTRYGNKFSSARILDQGVGEGTVGDPYANNVTTRSPDVICTGNSAISIFADDSIQVVSGKSGRDNAKEHISHIKKLFEDQILTLNTAKSFELWIKLKLCVVSKLEPVEGFPVRNGIRILGVIFDKYLTFQVHINDVAKKCSQCLYICYSE